MSSPPRPLFALAFTAALLAACSAADHCSSATSGERSTTQVELIHQEFGSGTHDVDIANACPELGGVKVTACNPEIAPVVTMNPWPAYSPAVVNTDSNKSITNVYIVLYCKH